MVARSEPEVLKFTPEIQEEPKFGEKNKKAFEEVEKVIKFPKTFDEAKMPREMERVPDATKMVPETQTKIPEKTTMIIETPKVVSEAPAKVSEKSEGEKKRGQEVPKKVPEKIKMITESPKMVSEAPSKVPEKAEEEIIWGQELPKRFPETQKMIPEKPKEKKVLQEPEKILIVSKKVPETPKKVIEEMKVKEPPSDLKSKTEAPQVEIVKTPPGYRAPQQHDKAEKPQQQGRYVYLKVSKILSTNLYLS